MGQQEKQSKMNMIKQSLSHQQQIKHQAEAAKQQQKTIPKKVSK